MSKQSDHKFLAWSAIVIGLMGLMGLMSGLPAESRKTAKMGEVIPMSPPPMLPPQSYPQPDERGNSPLSVDSQGNGSDHMKFEPYNTFPREIDLWTLEKARFIRSIPVLTPEKDAYAYSEVLFVPNLRQTICKMYLVRVPAPPVKAQPHLPSEDVAQPPAPPPDPKVFQDRYDPAKTVQNRQAIVQAGFENVKSFDFKTLTIVDWNTSGRRLLFKQRSGVLHVGVRVTDILIYDEERGTVTIYPEVQRIIKHYWMTHGNLPNMESLSWEIQPLGWEPGSESNILMKAWAYDKREKKFLGLWRYDADAERTTLLQLEDDPVAVAANGWMATPIPIAPPHAPTLRQRLRNPFIQRSNTPPIGS
jgi:hypothetical protein